jgi:hypothetical protein
MTRLAPPGAIVQQFMALWETPAEHLSLAVQRLDDEIAAAVDPIKRAAAVQARGTIRRELARREAEAAGAPWNPWEID